MPTFPRWGKVTWVRARNLILRPPILDTRRGGSKVLTFRGHPRPLGGPSALWRVNSAHKTDLGRVTVLLEASMGDQKMLHLFALFQLRIKPLSNEHTWWLYLLETVWLMYLSMSALALKKLSVGNMGDQKQLRLFSLSSYVQNNYLNDIADACLCWERFD